MIGFNDLREWMKQANEAGELQVIEGAETDLEVGTIAQINAKNEGPALLFDKLKGYREGYRILVNTMSNIKTLNLTFGLPINNKIDETIATLRVKAGEWAEKAKAFPFKVVESGPILENEERGDKIDLTSFPVPLWHEMDGGKYIGTGVGVITRDPDTGSVNVGTYRVQLHDSRTVGFYISPGKEGRLHRDKYFERGQPCPVAMVFGCDPLSYALFASDVPKGIFEIDYLGAMKEQSAPVIEGKITGLPIPANAELAIEGFSNPKESRIEGPFGEWTGTYASKAREEPFVKAEALYYRNDPIILGSPPAKGAWSDHILFRCVWRSALLFNEIAKSGIPNVKGVWLPPFGGARQFIIVSIRQSYPGHATEVGHVASQTRAGAYAGKWVVVVDDDINPYDMDDVMWALCTRAEPVEMDFIKRAWSTPLDPRIRKPTDNFHNSRGIIYAVKPYEWFGEFPPTNLASEEERSNVFSRWGKQLGGRWKTL